MDPKEEQPKSNRTETENEQKPTGELSAEEQMERYEESLKESDWGHQPC